MSRPVFSSSANYDTLFIARILAAILSCSVYECRSGFWTRIWLWILARGHVNLKIYSINRRYFTKINNPTLICLNRSLKTCTIFTIYVDSIAADCCACGPF